VDLAGSEKLNKTGASGDRMKEGCSINKSLSQLGTICLSQVWLFPNWPKMLEEARSKLSLIEIRS
jgi:hypothetical protein